MDDPNCDRPRECVCFISSFFISVLFCFVFVFFVLFCFCFIFVLRVRGKGGQLMLGRGACLCGRLFALSFDVLGPRISLITILYLLLAFTSLLWPIRFFLIKNHNTKMLFLRSCFRRFSTATVITSLSSSSIVNSFFFTCLSWLRKLNSAAFFWSLANLFSYLDTLRREGLILHGRIFNEDKWLVDRQYETRRMLPYYIKITYNLPRRSLTRMLISLICQEDKQMAKNKNKFQ